MTAQTKHYFSLVVRDPTTQSVSFETSLEVDVSELCAVLDLNPDDVARGACYDLDASDIRRLTDFYEIQFDPPSGAPVELRKRGRTDQLPYKVLNRELAMMLAQRSRSRSSRCSSSAATSEDYSSSPSNRSRPVNHPQERLSAHPRSSDGLW
jgi:hypothetical protein